MIPLFRFSQDPDDDYTWGWTAAPWVFDVSKCRGFGGDWIWDRFVWGLGF